MLSLMPKTTSNNNERPIRRKNRAILSHHSILRGHISLPYSFEEALAAAVDANDAAKAAGRSNDPSQKRFHYKRKGALIYYMISFRDGRVRFNSSLVYANDATKRIIGLSFLSRHGEPQQGLHLLVRSVEEARIIEDTLEAVAWGKSA
jgi:hypothetical protein